MTAIVVAISNRPIRNGRVCPMPPSVVIRPQTAPRSHGWPRPVRLPSSERASAKPMLMPAPTEAASPTAKASWVLMVAKAVAKIGASVETEPSIRPARPGCTICNKKRFEWTSGLRWPVTIWGSRLRATPGKPILRKNGARVFSAPPLPAVLAACCVSAVSLAICVSFISCIFLSITLVPLFLSYHGSTEYLIVPATTLALLGSPNNDNHYYFTKHSICYRRRNVKDYVVAEGGATLVGTLCAVVLCATKKLSSCDLSLIQIDCRRQAASPASPVNPLQPFESELGIYG